MLESPSRFYAMLCGSVKTLASRGATVIARQHVVPLATIPHSANTVNVRASVDQPRRMPLQELRVVCPPRLT